MIDGHIKNRNYCSYELLNKASMLLVYGETDGLIAFNKTLRPPFDISQ